VRYLPDLHPGDPENIKRVLMWLLSLSRRNQLLLFGSFVWAVITLLAHFKLFYWLESRYLDVTFAEGFWPNFLADVGVGLLLAWFLGDALDRVSHYNLMLNPIVLQDNEHLKTIQFDLVNNGQEGFKGEETDGKYLWSKM
jgi:hypothetical protein